MNDKRFWIGFNLVKGIGAVRMRALLAYFDSLADAWVASPDQLREAGLSPKVAETVAKVRAGVDLDRVWSQIAAQGITILTWEDELYPPRLKEIEQPPPIIYVRGEVTLDDHFAVAIVGTRLITPYGRQITEELASFLAGQGVTGSPGWRAAWTQSRTRQRSRQADEPSVCSARAWIKFIRPNICRWPRK
jgi:DNA processing protein